MRFDWAALMRAGMRGAGLSPEAFWRLTPVELLILLGLEIGAAPLTRTRLRELSALYPDRPGVAAAGRDPCARET